jgi:hypothetical protein
METSVAGVTVTVTLPETPERVAVRVVAPAVSELVRPAALIVATWSFEEVHVTVLETSCLDPSLKTAVAVSWSVTPAGTVKVAGLTEIELTVRVVGLVLPDPPHAVSTFRHSSAIEAA